MTFNSKGKVREITIVTKSAASRPFRDVAKIMFYIGRKKSPISISFVRQ